jgi:hypothetical protein
MSEGARRMTITISKTNLARNTREVVEQVRRGQTIIVESIPSMITVIIQAAHS